MDGLLLASEIISLRYDPLQVLCLDPVRDPWVEYGATVGQDDRPFDMRRNHRVAVWALKPYASANATVPFGLVVKLAPDALPDREHCCR